MRLLNVLRGLDLPQWRVAAGCIYQTVWNALTDRPQGTGINDYDVIYFDGDDLSRKTEIAVEGSVRSGVPTAPLRPRCATARVHFWFKDSSACPTRHYLLRMSRLRDIPLPPTPSACAAMTTA
jgi:hypothetical protein